MVELLILELQRRRVYWKDYPAPEGTFRENLRDSTHPSAQFKWNTLKEIEEHLKEDPLKETGKLPNGFDITKLSIAKEVKLVV